MGMLLRRHYTNTNDNKGVAEMVAPKIVEEEVKVEVVEENSIKEESKYTKTEINRKSTAELRVIAKEIGVENADLLTGSEIKKILIEKLGL